MLKLNSLAPATIENKGSVFTFICRNDLVVCANLIELCKCLHTARAFLIFVQFYSQVSAQEIFSISGLAVFASKSNKLNGVNWRLAIKKAMFFSQLTTREKHFSGVILNKYSCV